MKDHFLKLVSDPCLASTLALAAVVLSREDSLAKSGEVSVYG